MEEGFEVDSGDKAIIILQSLICYLREKNVLSRADIQELRDRVDARILAVEGAAAEKAMPCNSAAAVAAAREMASLDEYCGKRYGGKHRKAH
ncbi:hypothetical protein ACLIMP_19380 [Novosphingobium aerophilum]|uniref:hypothetical protein n=1 Tax=Novosphingobium TaxID=165696 RepID=UPI0006C855D0|nr:MULTISPECIES: hypothetical protein [unclassified Novosphingobium]KPH58119.1 hypothetical protein ADT71_26845 [Novosphingobium sp. ST904]MPS67995.1 hypothetical protein [Novosphingobium sp.]TCM41420.1 hypothetical protein EDF59_103171 [Novosphingobium sp. ST904]WRT95425.1 hypothetical protein U9J33_17590 [Novosphingobium sp. RL4]